MKMRHPHCISLPDLAISLIRKLQALNSRSAYLFPTLRRRQRPTSANSLNAGLRRISYTGKGMSAHGFRATFSTLANESGLWNPGAIGRQLALIEANAVRRAYARSEHWEERIRMMDWIL